MRNAWVNLCPFSVKVTDFCPFISRTSPVPPYGLVLVTLNSSLDMLGCKIEIEPVSVNRLLCIPSISTRTVGVLCSNTTETDYLMAALSWASRWKVLPSFSPLTRFPDFFPQTSRPFTWGVSFPRNRKSFQHSLGFLSPGASEDLCFFVFLVGHSVAKCPSPSNS